MNQKWAAWALRLRQMLGAEVRIVRTGEDRNPQHVYIPIPGDERLSLEVTSPLTERERLLISALLSEWAHKNEPIAKREGFAEKVARWLRDAERDPDTPVPGELLERDWEGRVPLLVVHTKVAFPLSDLAVLESYFEQQAWLIPMRERELLVMVPVSLIQSEEETALTEELYRAGEGLVEVAAAEIGETVTVVIHPPLFHPDQLPVALKELRTAWRLGRRFHPQRTVIATWNARLERLLTEIPDDVVRRWLMQSPSPFWEDGEIRETLTALFRHNLNLSETARALYVHRNTLLYRLERLKQETGLDARRFEDAVYMYTVLLLTPTEVHEE
ncbi:PucR family transcriptional regulator [Polycladomyces subterraneus]|uniref:Helix-turn-helix domain-containing protein n=1 Tax=Polycladomyces subterraneus TaxID=1016997 RepID=A0ABT8INQ8_9BACL|nr:helix-turn-helix domain-containing protein [Polycladomyces subterraneus]MDN4594370.1 helix-turn-helix domain-containing protein [Polycladomyces subterraneus]